MRRNAANQIGVFWAKVDKSGGADACWIWTGNILPNGYGRFGGYAYAHRTAYQLTYGEIPEGKLVCHHCDVRACCNPKHLFLGTPKDNTDDMVQKGRVASGDRNGSRLFPERLLRGEKNSNAKLTTEAVREMRRQSANGVSGYQLAKRFHVHVMTVSCIIRRKTWAHVTD